MLTLTGFLTFLLLLAYCSADEPLDGLKYEYKAITSKPLELDCCVQSEIEAYSIEWQKVDGSTFTGNGEKYELKDESRRLIEDSRTSHSVLRDCPVTCYGYGVDIQSMFVIQLAVKHADLRKINIAADEQTVWNTFGYWLAGMKTQVGSLKYVPKLIKPVVRATGTVYEKDEVVRYGENIVDKTLKERTDLEQKLKTKVNWFDAETMNVVVNKSIPSKSQLVVTLFNSAKEMERRGMVLVRNYHNRVSQVKPREASDFRFSVHTFERALLHKIAVSSALVEQVQGYENLCSKVTVEYRYNSSALENECKVLHHHSVDSSVTLRLRLNQEEVLPQNPVDYTIKWTE
ncbi:unnamed protein product [Echinostoma caproni]|uniref:Secreted protein n=1 Tax=Echinostoma caproni TaxID=27848 RepID=A0A183ALP4_9TREM|nr:unnamed protein product [Echinostoma caproni]